MKPLEVSDLIGRKFIDVDIDFLRSYVKDKSIIVTGAGGSIGSELSRQLSLLNPAFLGLLDRDESGLLSTQLSINNQGLLNTSNLLLADIRDEERLEEIFNTHKPDLVFHAAALKHLPLLQANPNEAWKTNIVGTLKLLELSNKHRVDTFVNISTDKAADPISILGHSKLLTEQLTSYFGQKSTQTKFVSVRFGNVFGSRGSVIGTFNHQINVDGPVIVTGPEVTRFFMTIHEAVHLVLRASRIGINGDTSVLNMGSPVNILGIAEKLIQRSGKNVEVRFSGLREGEKEHETLFASNEQEEETRDPMISKTRVEELESIDLEKLQNLFIERISGKK
jgi:FlaA1/EpsC-like NDP-sugar epimerase